MEYKFARLPDGTLLQFPADTSDSVMDSVVARHMKVPQIKPVPGVAPDTQEGMGWGDVATEAVKNVIPSAKRAAGEIWDAVSDPVGTAKAVGNVALGGIQKLIPGEQEEEKYADAVGQYFADRYGSMEGFKKSLAYDPVGVLSDLSSVFTGGAGLAKGLGKAAGVASARAGANLATVGKGLEKAARYTDPVQVPAFLLGKTADIGYGRTMTAAQKLYQSALKPSTAKYTPDQITGMVQAALDERIPVTASGVNKANRRIAELGEQLDRKIADADAVGRAIDPEQIAKGALWSPARQELANTNSPFARINQFDNAVAEYLDAHGADSTVSAAQAGKKATYKTHSRAYQNNTPDMRPGRTAAEMELARQQRMAIEQAVPEARDINRAEGNLIGLRDELERAAIRTGNNNPISLSGMITGAATGGASGNLGLGAGMAALTSLAGSPGIKSRAAFFLDDLSKQGLPTWLHDTAALNYAAGSTGSIQNWYDQMYGKRPYGGLLGEFARSDRERR